MQILDAQVSSSSFEGIRGLEEDVAKLYGIQKQMGEDGKPVRYAFKYPDNVKYRAAEEWEHFDSKKKYQLKHKGALLDLFGPEFNAGTSKRLYLTEGEIDAASLYQILGKTYPVKGLPTANWKDKHGRFLKRNRDYIASFEQIVYAGELDEKGRKSADQMYELFPEKFYFVSMSEYKDANEFLTAGAADSLKWAAHKPQRYTPENFFVGDDVVAEALRNENPYQYVPTGHAGYDGACRGLVRGGLTFIKAPRGTGKTEVIRFFEMGLLNNSEEKFAALHMEEMKSTTYRAMATYHLGNNVRTKDDAKENGYTEKQVEKAAQEAAKNDHTVLFEMRSSDDPLKLLDYIRLAATVYGCGYIFIDHVQRLAYLSQTGVDGATSTLTTLGSRAAQLAKELNIGVIFISQVNDDGRTKYAGALEEEAIICMKLERDVESEDEIERNTTNLVIDKNRPFSNLGPCGSLYYDPETTILREDY